MRKPIMEVDTDWLEWLAAGLLIIIGLLLFRESSTFESSVSFSFFRSLGDENIFGAAFFLFGLLALWISLTQSIAWRMRVLMAKIAIYIFMAVAYFRGNPNGLAFGVFGWIALALSWTYIRLYLLTKKQ